MGKTKLILLAVVGAALARSVSPKVTTFAPAAVNFHQFHTVKLVVTNLAKTAHAKEGLPRFEGLLKGWLQLLGCGLVEADPEMIMNVTGSPRRSHPHGPDLPFRQPDRGVHPIQRTRGKK